MDKQKIYKRIHDIAHELNRSQSTYTRADLAYELHDDGVKNDSFEVGQLVFDAYNYYQCDDAIKNAFYDNENRELLVPCHLIDSMMEENDSDALFPLLQSKLDESNELLDLLNNTIMQVLNSGMVTAAGRDILNTVVGTQGVVNVQNEAKDVFHNYSNLVSAYDGAKHNIKSVMADFVSLRTQICDVYRKFSTMLIDVFGDSIKAVNPELFDFDSIEWLDVHGMLQNVKLDYDRISEKCQTLMSGIQESFSQSLKSSSAAYRQGGNKQIGLLLAGLNMVSHYMDASSKTNVLKQDLVALKNSVKRDATQIKGDMGRLFVIYKTINDLYIPKAEAFSRNCNSILSYEWQSVVDSIYMDEEINSLKNQRDNLLHEYKQIEKEMTDGQMNIDFYTSQIEQNSQILNGLRPQYEEAKNNKPRKPFFLINLFTFGSAGKQYNRDIYEWHQACKPVISRYEDLQTDVKVDNDELQAAKNNLQENKRVYDSLKKELDRTSKIMKDRLKVNKDVKMAVLPHLESIIQLLRLAREIANSKLDEKYMRTVTIDEEDTKLPENIRQNISCFAESIRGTINIDANMAQKAVKALSYEDCDTTQEDYGESGSNKGQIRKVSDPNPITEEDLAAVADMGNVAVQKAVNLLESWMELKTLQERSAVAHKAYNKKLKKLQDEFKADMAMIDNKSAVLRESLKKINTAQNMDLLKEGLLSLSNGDKKIFDEKDWDDFLSGNKTIEL